MIERIVYTKHAEERIKQRSISITHIEEVVNDPENVVEENEIEISQKIIGDKLLRVVFKRTGNSIVIITAYFTRKERYGGDKNED